MQETRQGRIGRRVGNALGLTDTDGRIPESNELAAPTTEETTGATDGMESAARVG